LGAGGVAQAIENLPSKHKALSSNSSAGKKKKHIVGLALMSSLTIYACELECQDNLHLM
jgi:heme/copper-type cytochrome/quinol oxidase subunit 4